MNYHNTNKLSVEQSRRQSQLHVTFSQVTFRRKTMAAMLVPKLNVASLLCVHFIFQQNEKKRGGGLSNFVDTSNLTPNNLPYRHLVAKLSHMLHVYKVIREQQ